MTADCHSAHVRRKKQTKKFFHGGKNFREQINKTHRRSIKF